MAYGVKLRVWGDLALFTRPEMKVERVSYDVITPSAARGILEAIYWKPQMRWIIDRIHVLAPIRSTSVRRNEIKSRVPARSVEQARQSGTGSLALDITADRQQRASLLLRDVQYGIEAHVNVLDPREQNGTRLGRPEAKHLDSFRRRASRGQYFHHPYLGCREFPAHFELVDQFPAPPPEVSGERDFGYMLHDIEFVPDPHGRVVEAHRGNRLTAEPRFFRALSVNGVIEVPPLKSARA